MKRNEEKVNILGSMKALEVGGCVSFPIERLTSVRASASLINATRRGQSLSTSINRESGTVTVTRKV